MSTNKEQIQDINNQRSKKCLFLRVCYRHKCKLRSFECFPSFKELINVIIKLYPSIKSELSSSPFANRDKNKNNKNDNNKNRNDKDSKRQQCWRLETNESDWIQNDNDWNVMIQYLKHSKSNKKKKTKITPNGYGKRNTFIKENDSSSNHEKKDEQTKDGNKKDDDSILFTLRLIIEDQENDPYDPKMPSFIKCYKNPLTLINER